ncbi:MAG: hypothetical protein H8E32_18020 [Nitrospinae bacterium]|nr:hypothetical protein [Nitrospinota bacterium]
MGVCVVHTASLGHIIKRIRDERNRPTLKEGLRFEEEQKKIIERREGEYGDAGDFVCAQADSRPGQTVGEITDFLKSKGWI